MTVKAWLEGHEPDLRSLTTLLAEADVRVVHDADEDAYYLSCPTIDNPPEAGRYDQAAEALLPLVNGLARVGNSGHRAVKLTGKYSDGDKQHVFASFGLVVGIGLAAEAVVLGPDGKPKPDPPSPWPGRLALAESNPDAAEVLDILGRAEPLRWDDLYKVHEIIRHSVMPAKIPDLGWADKATDSAFTGSANLPGVSGSGARHARMEGSPKRTMTIDEGRDYISGIVIKWMDWLRNQP